MITGPFRGTSIYRRAADVSRLAAIGALVLGLLTGASVLGLVQMARFSATVDAMEDSAISFMPRVNIEKGWATVEAAPGRLIETDRVVVLFDTNPEPQQVPKGFGDDVRPRVLVGDRALLLYTIDRSVPLALPWGQVNQGLGPRVSFDGPEFIAALRRVAPRLVLTISGTLTVLALLWEFLLLGLLVAMYRMVFGRRIGSPSMGRLFVVGCLASLPAVALAVMTVLVTSRQEWALLMHGATIGGLVLLGGNTLVGLAPRARPSTDGELGPAPRAIATEL